MSKIFLTGDTHWNAVGEMRKFNSTNFPIWSTLTKDDYVIILGDFGFLFEQNITKESIYWLNWLCEKPWTTLFIDWNHENFNLLNQFPEVSMFWGTVWEMKFTSNETKYDFPIYHLKRGEIYTIADQKIFVMWGALSIDKGRRTPWVSWWPQEIPDSTELRKGYDSLDNVNCKVDYIFSHTCPENKIDTVFWAWFGEKHDDLVAKYFNSLVDTVEYKHWYFGHFHQNVTVDKFTCLYGAVIELGTTITSNHEVFKERPYV